MRNPDPNNIRCVVHKDNLENSCSSWAPVSPTNPQWAAWKLELTSAFSQSCFQRNFDQLESMTDQESLNLSGSEYMSPCECVEPSVGCLESTLFLFIKLVLRKLDQHSTDVVYSQSLPTSLGPLHERMWARRTLVGCLEAVAAPPNRLLGLRLAPTIACTNNLSC